MLIIRSLIIFSLGDTSSFEKKEFVAIHEVAFVLPEKKYWIFNFFLPENCSLELSISARGSRTIDAFKLAMCQRWKEAIFMNSSFLVFKVFKFAAVELFILQDFAIPKFRALQRSGNICFSLQRPLINQKLSFVTRQIKFVWLPGVNDGAFVIKVLCQLSTTENQLLNSLWQSVSLFAKRCSFFH